jgi:hypothetical protein
MIRYIPVMSILLILAGMPGCRDAAEQAEQPRSFADDVAFLSRHVEVILLDDDNHASQVAVVPAWQGRVMTSTNGGPSGPSFGWINYDLIRSGEIQPHMNAFGGEDRFWMGPEGGQFSIFFKQGDPFDLAHWQTPPSIDTEPFDTIDRQMDRVSFRRDVSLTNYSGYTFDLRIDRSVHLLTREEAARQLGMDAGNGLQAVSYETRNHLTNRGSEAWTKERGLLSIWILGMFNPSDRTTVLIPFRGAADDAGLGPVVNDAYFGKVPEDRLIIGDGVIFFRGDGKHRSKIGLTPQRATDLAGGWDASGHVLTIVQYNQPEGVMDYVNSMWEIQEEPYRGDVINSYNDGPPEPGAKPLGPFYELETSSPAAALAPGESILHVHRTTHLTGDLEKLAAIVHRLFGVSLDEIPW